MRSRLSSILCLSALAVNAVADPTWPNAIDDLEEIMYQVFDFRARRFADLVHPCDNQGSGAGRQNAAEWLRTGFHDMSTANTFFGTGGLDGSLQYELTNGENAGPGFARTLSFMAPYFSKKTSVADLIALGVYTSVRACDGPVIPVRHGRVDATRKGSTGVPQVGNSVLTFKQQFSRMGFDEFEMIQLVACGHSLGGVHSTEFPALVPPGQFPNDRAPLDSTPATYDNRVVTEYLDDSTDNPLVKGPSIGLGHNSDFKVFSSDGNATMQAMADNTVFQSTCRDVLGRMIDVVPKNVVLTSPVQPYMVKPVNLQLILNAGGATTLQWTGYIRVRTTELPLADIQSVTVTYKDRNGGSSCGSSTCSRTLTVGGIGRGFDDSFAFFPINTAIPASSGISSFTITINKKNGEQLPFDNNGNAYPMQDAVVLQKQQTCLLQTSGAFTLTAAVRNDVADQEVRAKIAYKTKRDTSPVPLLQEMTLTLSKGNCYGGYTFFSGSTTIPGGLSFESTVDISAGEYVEAFRSVDEIGGSCREFTGAATCSTANPSSSSSSSSSVSSASVETSDVPTSGTTSADSSTSTTANPSSSSSSSSSPSSSDVPTSDTTSADSSSSATENPSTSSSSSSSSSVASTSSETSADSSSDATANPSTSSSSSFSSSSSSSSSSPASTSAETSDVPTSDATSTDPSTSATPTQTSPHHRPSMGGYVLVSCWTEGASGVRALKEASFASDDMTLESCMAYCAGYLYWGTEYGRECFCGDSLDSTSSEAPLSECDMACSGDAAQYCGAGNRLELYSTTATAAPTATPTPDEHFPAAVGPYSLVGCWKEGANGVRALDAKATASPDMTLDKCAEFCDGHQYFGAEYGSECFCGDDLHESSSPVPISNCNTPCPGNATQHCGSANRLTLYRLPDYQAPHHPSPIGPYTFAGCRTELGPGARALAAAAFADDDMTNGMCAGLCAGYALFGTEYGRECFCGDELGEGSEVADVGDCAMVCAGDEGELCGGPNRLSVYSLGTV